MNNKINVKDDAVLHTSMLLDITLEKAKELLQVLSSSPYEYSVEGLHNMIKSGMDIRTFL